MKTNYVQVGKIKPVKYKTTYASTEPKEKTKKEVTDLDIKIIERLNQYSKGLQEAETDIMKLVEAVEALEKQKPVVINCKHSFPSLEVRVEEVEEEIKRQNLYKFSMENRIESLESKLEAHCGKKSKHTKAVED